MAYIFSKGCGYGIQATLYVAMHGGDRVGGKDIATKLQIPSHFLAKILQALSEHNVLDSQKGAQGGFKLARDPKDIPLLDIVRAVDGLSILHECVLGFPNCGTENPCFMHSRWGGIRTELEQMLRADTIADLLDTSRSGTRIAGAPLK